MRNLFDENVRQREAERRNEHRTDTRTDKFSIGFELTQNDTGKLQRL